MNKLFPTTLVGSYPQPDWLIDRARLAGHPPPRIRSQELWRIAPEFLEQAQDDATLLAIREQEEAASTSSPTAKFAAKAIRTALPPRSKASISQILPWFPAAAAA